MRGYLDIFTIGRVPKGGKNVILMNGLKDITNGGKEMKWSKIRVQLDVWSLYYREYIVGFVIGVIIGALVF